MEKSIRLIHIRKLSKENIFSAYKNLNFCKFLMMSSFENLYSDSWEIIRQFCRNPKEAKIQYMTETPFEYENLVIVNIGCANYTDSSDNEFAFADISYLLTFLFQLDESYTVCFYNEDSLEQDTQNDYFRISAFMNIWLAQTKKINKFLYLDITNGIDKGNFNPKKLAFSFATDTPSETILPIISLNQEVFQCLERPYIYDRPTHSLNGLLRIIKTNQSADLCCKYYEEFIYQAIRKMLNISQNEKEIKQEDFLKSKPPLIVLYIYSIIKSHISKEDLSQIEFEALVEKSFDFSNGLMQLIENSIKHVVAVEEKGCAFFSIRMHHHQGAMDKYLCNDRFKVLKYFLEITVLDSCKYSTTTGIVARYNMMLKEKGLDVIDNLNDIFDYSDVLEKYYNDVRNVANHYGLQIFDTVLTSNQGLFIVKSGESKSPYIYNNAYKVFDGHERVYKDIDEEAKKQHFSGTDYTIILPIGKNEHENCTSNLSLGNVPLTINSDYDCVGAIELAPLKLTSGTKDEFVEKYMTEIKGLITDDTKGIIAFDIKEISKSRMQLELVCKAVISFIAGNQENISAICLLNIEDEYRLLDAIRIIALFYDKTGKCKFMQGKGIYLASDDGELDILFAGNDIKSVLENIDQQRLMKSLPQSFYKHISHALTDRTFKEKSNG